jgi:hypothetical protein
VGCAPRDLSDIQHVQYSSRASIHHISAGDIACDCRRVDRCILSLGLVAQLQHGLLLRPSECVRGCEVTHHEAAFEVLVRR